jgi:hypothetical protein
VVGRKVFWLASPIDAHWAQLHPEAHPQHRQSQRDFEEPSAFEGFERVWRVALEPGEVLYLPPYMLHRVESGEGLTASVNVFSHSAENGAAAAMVGLGLPDALQPRRGLSSRVRMQVCKHAPRGGAGRVEGRVGVGGYDRGPC